METTDWEDVADKKPLWVVLKDFSKYFIVATVLVIYALLAGDGIESDKYIMIPLAIVVITGCLYVAHISIKVLEKSFK